MMRQTWIDKDSTATVALSLACLQAYHVRRSMRGKGPGYLTNTMRCSSDSLTRRTRATRFTVPEEWWCTLG